MRIDDLSVLLQRVTLELLNLSLNLYELRKILQLPPLIICDLRRQLTSMVIPMVDMKAPHASAVDKREKTNLIKKPQRMPQHVLLSSRFG